MPGPLLENRARVQTQQTVSDTTLEGHDSDGGCGGEATGAQLFGMVTSLRFRGRRV